MSFGCRPSPWRVIYGSWECVHYVHLIYFLIKISRKSDAVTRAPAHIQAVSWNTAADILLDGLGCESSCVALENEKWSKWVFGSKRKKCCTSRCCLTVHMGKGVPPHRLGHHQLLVAIFSSSPVPGHLWMSTGWDVHSVNAGKQSSASWIGRHQLWACRIC